MSTYLEDIYLSFYFTRPHLVFQTSSSDQLDRHFHTKFGVHTELDFAKFSFPERLQQDIRAEADHWTSRMRLLVRPNRGMQDILIGQVLGLGWGRVGERCAWVVRLAISLALAVIRGGRIGT